MQGLGDGCGAGGLFRKNVVAAVYGGLARARYAVEEKDAKDGKEGEHCFGRRECARGGIRWCGGMSLKGSRRSWSLSQRLKIKGLSRCCSEGVLCVMFGGLGDSAGGLFRKSVAVIVRREVACGAHENTVVGTGGGTIDATRQPQCAGISEAEGIWIESFEDTRSLTMAWLRGQRERVCSNVGAKRNNW
ncbi:hypothetical protein K438DRAFT_1942337 [Mycena galopus ATCC 62051]|nr:hypothetical protein K438DRAFT_1942337 [Mycena galopus ATCC 62051]